MPNELNQNPEQKACDQIDAMLQQASCYELGFSELSYF